MDRTLTAIIAIITVLFIIGGIDNRKNNPYVGENARAEAEASS